MILKKKTQKKNHSNRKPISYFTEFRLDINLNNFVRKLCAAMINVFQDILCYIYKRDYSTGGNNGMECRGQGVGERGEKGCRAKVLQTYRPSDEAGPRGVFAPKNEFKDF